MNQEKAKEWASIFQAVAAGRILQRVRSDGHTYGTEWFDVQESDIDLRLPISCYRLKPREFKNFDLPWGFIDARWNYATYESGVGGTSAGVVLYESKPKFVEKNTVGRFLNRAVWETDVGVCTWINLMPTQEGINETDWLACRNEN